MSGIRLIAVTVICPLCPRKFHQIDSTEERAKAVAHSALDRHLADAHPEDDQ